MNAMLPKTTLAPQRARKCAECGGEFIPVPLAHAPSFFTIDCAKCEAGSDGDFEGAQLPVKRVLFGTARVIQADREDDGVPF